MKRVVPVLALLLCAPSAWATDIDGKWGIGAGLFNGGSEISLIRGHSERTAYVFDVQLAGDVEDNKLNYGAGPDQQSNQNSWSVGFGPRLRRFTRPSSEFSPYWDLFMSTNYTRSHASGDRNGHRWGLATGVGFGLEYFTPWHCSIAAHSGFARLAWDQYHSESGTAPNTFGIDQRNFSVGIGIAPTLYVRAYF
jgi:hypothetical protein